MDRNLRRRDQSPEEKIQERLRAGTLSKGPVRLLAWLGYKPAARIIGCKPADFNNLQSRRILTRQICQKEWLLALATYIVSTSTEYYGFNLCNRLRKPQYRRLLTQSILEHLKL